MRRHILGGLAVCAAALALADARAAAPPRAAADTQHLVYLGDAGPLLIRLHLRLDGRPFRAAWEGFMDELFAYLDVDRDGVLSKEEAAALPPPGALSAGTPAIGRVGAVPRRATAMTRAQMADYYRNGGLAPFQITQTPRQTGVIRLNVDGTLPGRGASAQALNARLFALLDRDKDGKLSAQELAAAPAILGKLDVDEDEMLTSDELRGTAGGTAGDGQLIAFAPDGRFIDTSAGPRPFHVVADGPADPALARALLARYGKKGEKSLDAVALGMSRERLAQLDRDGDGRLDLEELSRLAPLTPDLEVAVRLGGSGKRPAVELVGKRAGLKAKVAATAGGVSLELGTVSLELRGPAPSDTLAGFAFDVKGQYKTQFANADADKNGYLDRAEAEKSPLFRGLFAAMDRDGDGMLYEKEVLAYVDRMEAFRNRATASCLSAVITDQGKGLFELVDADGDGRLSVRELRRMPELIKKLDQDGDGRLAPTEVPRRFRAAFERGPAGGGGSFGRVVVFAGGMDVAPALPTRTQGPVWFRKMDRNRDGDVSRREFLGTDDAFRLIDADGDGLISAEEAEKYDRLRRGKQP